jgi:g-D-glutamyl-meso-diaminopimelate peptidase
MEILVSEATGPDVKLIQSLLDRIGYNAGTIDGEYGTQTRQAIKAFQIRVC